MSSYRKLGQTEFGERISRVRTTLERRRVIENRRRRVKRPILCATFSCAWVTFAVYIAQRPDMIRASLAQGSLSAEHQTWVLASITAMLMISGLVIGLHCLRTLTAAGRSSVSLPITLGAIAAIGLAQIPETHYQTGLSLITTGSSELLVSAGKTAGDALGIDYASIRFVARQVAD